MLKLYNGCPNDELQAVLDERAAIRKEAESHGVFLCWFPVEERWAASRSINHPDGYLELSDFHRTMRGALDEAIERLREMEE